MLSNSDFQKYFVERLTELWDKKTLDSYRVRSHNILSLLSELLELINGLREGRVKNIDTVISCRDEVLEQIEDPSLNLVGMSIENIKKIFETYQKNGEKVPNSSKIEYCITKLLDANINSYINNLVEQIEEFLFDNNNYDDKDFSPKFEEFDHLIHRFATELINRQFSKTFLYFKLKDLRDFWISSKDFSVAYNKFKTRILEFSSSKYTVILSLRIDGNAVSELKSVPFTETISQEIIDKYNWERSKPKCNGRPNWRYFVSDIEALDVQKAISKTLTYAFSLLDFYQIGSSIKSINVEEAYVLCDDGKNLQGHTRKNVCLEYDGGVNGDISEVEGLRGRLKNLAHSDSLREETRERIKSACRYLRVGENAKEWGQAFINFWIALEFLYSAPQSHELTITRLKTNLINILSVCYSKRNFLYLEKILNKYSSFKKLNKRLWEFTIDEITDLRNNIDSINLKFKLSKLKSWFWCNKDKTERYIKNHRKNLEHHLTRIYMNRNELIHEAAIKADIEGLASNLRYYLLFTLVQMDEFFSNNKLNSSNPIGMEEFFLEYQLLYDELKQDMSLKNLMKMPLNNLILI